MKKYLGIVGSLTLTPLTTFMHYLPAHSTQQQSSIDKLNLEKYLEQIKQMVQKHIVLQGELKDNVNKFKNRKSHEYIEILKPVVETCQKITREFNAFNIEIRSIIEKLNIGFSGEYMILQLDQAAKTVKKIEEGVNKLVKVVNENQNDDNWRIITETAFGWWFFTSNYPEYFQRLISEMEKMIKRR